MRDRLQGINHAPVWKRAVAHYIDLLIISIPLCIFIILIYMAMGPTEENHRLLARYDMMTRPFLPLWLLFAFFYFVLPEAGWGATAGKYFLGIRVAKVDGGKCGFRAALVRNILRIIDGLFGYLVGLLFVFTSPARQRLGDKLAGTVVITRN